MQRGKLITVHGDAAFHGVAMTHEDQRLWSLIHRKPSTCQQLHASRIQYEFLKINIKKRFNFLN